MVYIRIDFIVSAKVQGKYDFSSLRLKEIWQPIGVFFCTSEQNHNFYDDPHMESLNFLEYIRQKGVYKEVPSN